MLSSPNYSAEAIMRSAMRVAALCGHAFWRAWFQLQLMDLSKGAHGFRDLKAALDGQLPDERAKQVAEDVIVDYFTSRSADRNPDKVYGSSIGELQRMVKLFEDEIRAARGPVPPDFIATSHQNRAMFDAIISRTHSYLVTIESQAL